jgi:hypothetical protein
MCKEGKNVMHIYKNIIYIGIDITVANIEIYIYIFKIINFNNGFLRLFINNVNKK